MTAEAANLVLFVLGASLAGAATLALLPSFQPGRKGYSHRVFYFLWRYCLPVMLFEALLVRLWLGHFFP